MNKTRLLTTGLAAVGVGLVLTAGSCDEKGLGDAPIGDAYEAPRDVIVMPDLFPNLVVACDGPNRVYVTTREAAPVVLQNDPNCPPNGPSLEDQGEQIDPDTLNGEG